MPAIVEGLPAATRFSDAEPAFGNTYNVVSPLAMLKLPQLIMEVLEDWFIVRVLPADKMEAEPLPTMPPKGLASAHRRRPNKNAAQYKNSDFFI